MLLEQVLVNMEDQEDLKEWNSVRKRDKVLVQKI
jgi:hypothetical protein